MKIVIEPLGNAGEWYNITIGKEKPYMVKCYDAKLQAIFKLLTAK